MKKSVFIRDILIFAVLISLNVRVFSQSSNPLYDKMPRTIAPAGDAAALGRYGDYPVDKSTGVTSISIPFFKIQLNDFELPISISYHSAGNRVDDVSSVVGLGWALHAGGCISRTVKGKPDEWRVSNPVDTYDRQYSTREELLTDSDMLCKLHYLETDIDLESDIYSFNFNGYGGQFRYNSENKLVLSSFDDLKITGGPISGFTIYTPDGTKYRFFDGDSIRFDMGMTYKSCWYIKQIITANADTINFSYFSPESIVQYDHQPSYNCSNGPNHEFVDLIETLGLKYLQRISFRGGSLSFIYNGDRLDMRTDRLDKIAVLDYKGDTIKKASLSQSYFESPGLSSGWATDAKRYYKRLRLDHFDLVNLSNSSDLQRYSFEYNSTNLPPYFENFGSPHSYFSQDYWGYFNDATNDNLIPIGNPCFIAAANRDVNEEAMQATILKKIVYPTGGRTEFEYSANTRMSGSENGPKMGGLRIKKIMNFIDEQSTTPSLVKWYNYGAGGEVTAWLQEGDSQMDKLERWFYLNLNNGVTFNYNATPIGQISFCNGLTTIYPHVSEFTGQQKETESDYYYNINLEEQYTINSDLSFCWADSSLEYPIIIYPPGFHGPQLTHHLYTRYYKDRAWRSGQLAYQTDYKQEGGNYIPVRQIENTWSPYRVQDNIIGLKFVPLYSASTGCLPSGTSPDCRYQIFNVLWETGVMKLTRSVERLYSSTDTIEKTVVYKYDMIENSNGHGFVTKETQANSVGDSIWKINRYLPEAIQNPSGAYQVMHDKNMIASPIEVINGEKINGNDYYLSSDVYDFSLVENLPKLYQVKRLQLSTPSTSYTYLTDTRLKTEITFDNYDIKGNLLQFHKENDTKTSYIWGYNNCYPIIKGENASQDTLQAAVNNSLPTGFNSLEALLTSENGILGMTTSTQKTLWRTFCTNLKSQSSIGKTIISIFSYTPLVGMTSQTDSNGLTTYYEYDAFGRLKSIKDNDGNILKAYEYHYRE
jgi:YD repeat-containing protein